MTIKWQAHAQACVVIVMNGREQRLTTYNAGMLL